MHRSAIGAWVLSRYDDCLHVLRDPRFGKGIEAVSRRVGLTADQEAERAAFLEHRRSMLWLDPPDHTRLRGLVAKAFTARTVEALRPHIERLTDDLLDQLVAGDGVGSASGGSTGGGSAGGSAAGSAGVEVMEGLANALPIAVIGELLGIPTDERAQFRPLSRAGTVAMEPMASPESQLAAREARLEMEAYFERQVALRRQSPGDDLLSQLIAVHERGDVLTETEVISTAILLFGAGFETTANLIGNGLLALLRHPDQLRRLRDDPALLRPAVEELLRYDSAVQLNVRTALADVEVDGQAIAQGESVVTLVGAANRDPAHFTDPDRLDVGRDDGPSLAFGSGIHFCLGAALARVEGQVVFGRLVERFPDIELAAEPRYRPSVTMRGLEALHVQLEPRPV